MIFEAIFKVLPIILIMLLGMFLGRKEFFAPVTQQQLKNLVVNVSLPASLFLAFSRVRLEPHYLVIAGIVFASCWLVLAASTKFQQSTRIGSIYSPYLMTGFEAGMLGYAIFGAVYGVDNLYKFGVIDLGQVTFVFFIMVPALERQADQERPFLQIVQSFFKTPVILAIVGGMLFHLSGLYDAFSGQPLYESVQSTLQLLGSLTTPLVALVIGSEIRLDRVYFARPLVTSLVRFILWLSAALLFNWLVMDRLLGLDPIFQAAVLTMAILPPPFVIPFFMHNAKPDDLGYVVNTLSLSTILTLIAFVVVTLAIPPG